MNHKLTLLAVALELAWLAMPAAALEVGPVYNNTGPNGFPNQYFTGPVTITSGTFDDNAIRIFTLQESEVTGGGSFTIAVSNGENGYDGTVGNPDTPNPTPVGDVIDIINGGDGTMGNRIQNGNAFRFSVWMQQDPENPIVVEPSVEPVLKFELWKEAQSVYGDFEGRKPFADEGDRMWETDLNAPDPFYDGTGQSVSSNIDISGNGTVVVGDDPAYEIGPAAGVEWVLVETTIVIDDNIFDVDPQDNLGWLIGEDSFYVEHIEEVRATLFMGEFGDPMAMADGGRLFLDNALLEAFPDEATMLATANPNPVPVPALIGDYNDDGTVNAADYTLWRNSKGDSGNLLANRDPGISGLVKQSDYIAWRDHYGETSGGGAGSVTIIAYAPSTASPAVPEPNSALLALMGTVVAAMLAMRRR